MGEVLGAHRFRSIHRSAGALDIGRLLGFFICAHIVHGGEVKEVVDFPFQGFHRLGSMPRFLLVRSPMTAFTWVSSAPQRSRNLSSLSWDCSRTSTWTVPPRARSFSTRKRPINPVPPVRK